MKKKDSQKARVYAAERKAWGLACQANPKLEALNKDRSIEEAEAIIRELATRKRITNKFPRASYLSRVRVKAGRGGGWASPSGLISLGVWARRTHYVLLHEACHVFVVQGVWHGWQFCEAELWLWRQVYGIEAAKILEACFKEARVKYKAPRAKRQLTPEQRAAAIERLAAAREARAAQPPKPWVTIDGDRVCREHPDSYWPHGCQAVAS